MALNQIEAPVASQAASCSPGLVTEVRDRGANVFSIEVPLLRALETLLLFPVPESAADVGEIEGGIYTVPIDEVVSGIAGRTQSTRAIE